MVLVSAVVALAFLAIAIQGWLVIQLWHQATRLRARCDAVDLLAGNLLPETVPAAPLPAPAFDLPTLAGPPVTLERLLAPEKPLLLAFVNPRCAPCYEVLPDLGGWQRVYADHLTIAVVSGGTPEANRSMTGEYGIAPNSVLLQADHEIADAYAASVAPGAVVVLPSMRLAGPVVYGAKAIRQMVADTLGLVVPEAPVRGYQPLAVGQPVPSIRRPDLVGASIDLGSLRGAPTLVLFWSPGCSHCQELLPAMRAWETDPQFPRMVIVSRGPVAANREAGLSSPIVLDDDHGIGGRFGVTGTPAAVLINDQGMVASDVARGTRDVRALVAHRHAAVPPTAE